MSKKTPKPKKTENPPTPAAEEVVNELSKAAENLSAMASEKAADIVASAKAAAGQVGRAAIDEYARISGESRESFAQGREIANRWEKGLEDSVKERPLRSILIAAGIGCLLALLFSNERHD